MLFVSFVATEKVYKKLHGREVATPTASNNQMMVPAGTKP